MKKICKRHGDNWLVQDENKNLLLWNEKTGEKVDLGLSIQNGNLCKKPKKLDQDSNR